MLDNCTYYRNGSLKSIKLDDGSVVHYTEDGDLAYVTLTASNLDDQNKQLYTSAV